MNSTGLNAWDHFHADFFQCTYSHPFVSGVCVCRFNGPQSKNRRMFSPGALAGVAQQTEGQAPSRGHTGGNHTLIFLSLSPSLPLCLKTNKIFLKNNIFNFFMFSITAYIQYYSGFVPGAQHSSLALSIRGASPRTQRADCAHRSPPFYTRDWSVQGPKGKRMSPGTNPPMDTEGLK